MNNTNQNTDKTVRNKHVEYLKDQSNRDVINMMILCMEKCIIYLINDQKQSKAEVIGRITSVVFRMCESVKPSKPKSPTKLDTKDRKKQTPKKGKQNLMATLDAVKNMALIKVILDSLS